MHGVMRWLQETRVVALNESSKMGDRVRDAGSGMMGARP